jgi:hypothetical protein
MLGLPRHQGIYNPLPLLNSVHFPSVPGQERTGTGMIFCEILSYGYEFSFILRKNKPLYED